MTVISTDDAKTVEELSELLRQAGDKAHWLAAHRRMPLAFHIEEGIRRWQYITYDLRGQIRRGEAQQRGGGGR